MPQLRTKLSLDKCSQRLREQVQRRTMLSRFNIFRPATSRVIGDVSSDSFSLANSADRFSKRLVGRFVPQRDSTLIDYNGKLPLHITPTAIRALMRQRFYHFSRSGLMPNRSNQGDGAN